MKKKMKSKRYEERVVDWDADGKPAAWSVYDTVKMEFVGKVLWYSSKYAARDGAGIMNGDI